MLNKNPINIKQKNEINLLVQITNFMLLKYFFVKMTNTLCSKIILLLSCFFILKSNNFIRNAGQVEGLDINGIQFKEGKNIYSASYSDSLTSSFLKNKKMLRNLQDGKYLI
jgi:hypothetical protein